MRFYKRSREGQTFFFTLVTHQRRKILTTELGRQFSIHWLRGDGKEGDLSESRRRKGERAVWQRRYYEHTCRDESDLIRFMDYLHVNPLKHGLVISVKEWEWSSFHRYVKLGALS